MPSIEQNLPNLIRIFYILPKLQANSLFCRICRSNSVHLLLKGLRDKDFILA